MPLVEREKIWKTSFWNPDNAIASAINQRLSEHLGVLLLWAKRNTTASYQNYNTLAKMSSCTVDNFHQMIYCKMPIFDPLNHHQFSSKHEKGYWTNYTAKNSHFYCSINPWRIWGNWWEMNLPLSKKAEISFQTKVAPTLQYQVFESWC